MASRLTTTYASPQRSSIFQADSASAGENRLPGMGIADLGSSQPSHPARSGTRSESVTVTVSGSYVLSCTFSRCHTDKRRFGLSSSLLNSGPTETISMRQSSSMVFRNVAQSRESAAWKDSQAEKWHTAGSSQRHPGEPSKDGLWYGVPDA